LVREVKKNTTEEGQEKKFKTQERSSTDTFEITGKPK